MSQDIEYDQSTQKSGGGKATVLYDNYSHGAYKQMPKQTIIRHCKDSPFLSEATESLIQHVEFDNTPDMSLIYLKTAEASDK